MLLHCASELIHLHSVKDHLIVTKEEETERTCSVRSVGDDGEARAGTAVDDFRLADLFPSVFRNENEAVGFCGY